MPTDTVEKMAMVRIENRNSKMSWRVGGLSSRIFRWRRTWPSATQSTSQTATAKMM
jgi:hypothetical protein